MPKNVVFQTKKDSKSVVGKSKQTKMLRTNLQGGGTCDWVPEDETILIAKVITQDGTYKASDEPGNVYGYSEVTVQGIGDRIMGDLGTITINKNGTYYAKNTYTPTDLGSSGSSDTKIGPFYGYKTAIVNVTKSSNSSGSSSGSSGTESNSVIGKDSEGNYVEWKVDDDGVLTETKLADSIKITKKPKFLVYHDGDSINFSGIKVAAYVGSDVYKSDSHPNGVIAESELLFDTIVARGGGGSKQTITVTWPREPDGFMLETTFKITVNDAVEG